MRIGMQFIFKAYVRWRAFKRAGEWAHYLLLRGRVHLYAFNRNE